MFCWKFLCFDITWRPQPPPPKKQIAPSCHILVVCLRKIQNHQASLLAESSLKDFKLPLSWIVSVQHSILNIWLLKTYLQNINWLPVNTELSMYPVYLKEKMSFAPVYIPCPYNVFLNFLKGQVHKDSKLEIMTNVGKSHLCKHSQKG